MIEHHGKVTQSADGLMKERPLTGRVSPQPDAKWKRASRHHPPATREQRIWLYFSFFPAGFFVVFLVLLMASSSGFEAAVGIFAGLVLAAMLFAHVLRR